MISSMKINKTEWKKKLQNRGSPYRKVIPEQRSNFK